MGSLNLYFTTSPRLHPGTMGRAELFASHAAIALAQAGREEQLQEALGSRKVIGQAIGLTMERYRIDEERAFNFLVRASQTRNVKLRSVAHQVVQHANQRYAESPPDLSD